MIFFPRSAIGLTGLGGALWSHFSLGPVGAAGVLAARYIAFPLPEPEIQLPPGTEMRLLATSIPEDAPTTPVPPDLGVKESLAVWLQTHSRVVTKPDGTRAADVINLAFIGSARGTAERVCRRWLGVRRTPDPPYVLHRLSGL